MKKRLITGPILILCLLALVVLDDAFDTVHLQGFWQSLFLGREIPPRGMIMFLVSVCILPLAAAELISGQRDGISNEVVASPASVQVGGPGDLLLTVQRQSVGEGVAAEIEFLDDSE